MNSTTELPSECRNNFDAGNVHVIVTHLSLGLALLGIIVNIITLIVLNVDKNQHTPINILLKALAIEDILIILFYTIYYITINYFNYCGVTWLGVIWYVNTPLFYLLHWIKTIEIFTVILLSLDRYMAIRWPLKASRLCSVGRTKRELILIIVASGIFKLPNLIFDYRILEYYPTCGKYELTAVFQNATWYPTFKLVYVKIIDQVCSFITPLLLLVFLNCGIIIHIREYTKRHLCGHWSGKNSVRDAPVSAPSSINSEDGTYVKEKEELNRNHRSLKRPMSNFFRCCSSIPKTSTNINSFTKDFEPARGRILSKSEEEPTSPVPSIVLHNRSILLTLIGVVTIFIICETPTTICYLCEIWVNTLDLYFKVAMDIDARNSSLNMYYPSEEFYFYAYAAALDLVLVGCASNFFVYVLICSRFRQNFRYIIRRFMNKLFCSSGNEQVTPATDDTGLLRPLQHRNRSNVLQTADSRCKTSHRMK